MTTKANYYAAFFTLIGLCGCPSEKQNREQSSNAPQESSQTPSRTVKSEFQVKKDGFNFTNYGNHDGVRNLSPKSIEELCGKGVCARGSGNTCELSGALRAFMDSHNRSMSNGHCDGIAVVSQALHMELIPLGRYTKSVSKAYDLDKFAPNLQEDIAKFFASQSVEPARSSEIRVSPTQVLSHIRQKKDSYTLGLYNHDGSQGHSVTAIRVIDDNPRFSRIEIYDSNYPGEPQYIAVDKSSNTWEYEDYDTGDARTKSLTLIPLSSRFSPQQCPPDGNDDDSYDEEYDTDYEDSNEDEDDEYYRESHHLKNHQIKDNDTTPWTVWLDGPGKLVVATKTNSFPRRSRFNQLSLDPIYELNALQDNLISVQAPLKKTPTEQTTNVVAFRHGQSLSIEGINLSINEKDRIVLGGNGKSLRYETEDEEKITVRIGQTYKGADYEIKIHPDAQKHGFVVEVENIVDPRRGNHELLLRLKNAMKKPSSFTIEMTRIAEKNDVFTSKNHKALTIAADETLHIKYGKWMKDGQPLLLLIDKGSNDKIDEVKNIKDDN